MSSVGVVDTFVSGCEWVAIVESARSAGVEVNEDDGKIAQETQKKKKYKKNVLRLSKGGKALFRFFLWNVTFRGWGKELAFALFGRSLRNPAGGGGAPGFFE